MNPFGLAFALMTVTDLILVNHHGEVIGGGRPGRQIVNLAGFTIHVNSFSFDMSFFRLELMVVSCSCFVKQSAIHTARPDVNVIMHSHSVYGKAYSSLGKPVRLLFPFIPNFGSLLMLRNTASMIVTNYDTRFLRFLQ